MSHFKKNDEVDEIRNMMARKRNIRNISIISDDYGKSTLTDAFVSEADFIAGTGGANFVDTRKDEHKRTSVSLYYELNKKDNIFFTDADQCERLHTGF